MSTAVSSMVDSAMGYSSAFLGGLWPVFAVLGGVALFGALLYLIVGVAMKGGKRNA
jgi:hypothetical protein